MKDEITISLRALDDRGLAALEAVLENQLGIIEDETNAEALQTIKDFKE